MLKHIIDEDIFLRMFNINDAEEFFNLINSSRTYLKKWLGWVDNVEKVDDTVETINSRLRSFVETGGYPKSVAIIYRGEIAGTIGFNEISKDSNLGVIGYWLGERFQGKGIMTKALKAFIDYGFKDLELNQIEISVAVENKKSRALPERLGFTEITKLKQAEWLYDHYVDHIIYRIWAEDWD